MENPRIVENGFSQFNQSRLQIVLKFEHLIMVGQTINSEERWRREGRERGRDGKERECSKGWREWKEGGGEGRGEGGRE